MTHRCSTLLLFSALLCCCLTAPAAPPQKNQLKKAAAASSTPDAAAPTDDAKENVYSFSLVDPDGKVVSLSDYKGKLLLIVNLASQSMYNTQIAALNDLQKTYGHRGLQIIGIPSADFGNEELKDPAAVRKYYTDTAKVDFPVFATAKLTGIDAIPLYQFLTDPKKSVPGGEMNWNYTKFLIDRSGKPIARYEVGTDPADPDFRVDIESALSGKFKRSGEGGGGRKQPGGGDDDGPEA
jgi:glutathione peroxidase